MDIVATIDAGKAVVAQSPLSMGGVIGIVIASCAIGLVWAVFNYLQVKKVKIGQGSTGAYESVVEVN